MCLVLKFSGKWIVRTQNFQPFRCQPLLTLPAVQPLWNFVISWTRFTEMKIYSDSTSLNFFSPFFFYGKGCSSNGESVPSTPGILTPSGIPRKESYKMQRKNYRFEKKKAANELLCTLKDPTVIVLADWLKGKLTASVRQNWVDFL